MAFVTSNTLHPNQSGADELTLSTLTDAADYVSGRCLADSVVGPVGLELEAFCFDLRDPTRRPSWQELSDIIAGLPPLPAGSSVTVEPGGAVELSTPPRPDVVAAIEALTSDREIMTAAFARAGFGLALLGADPVRAPGRVNPGARYRAMEQYFAAARMGTAGAAMMTSTASIQVNLEAGPAEIWADRVRLAHALGPTMIAIAANSPWLAGKSSGWRSTRQRVWSQLDTARCGPILGANGDEPAADWVGYALRAPVMLVRTPGAAGDMQAEPVTNQVTFADWLQGEVDLGGRRPSTADLDYHLTTLFPPVRPRGWLEIRYLDSVGDHLWPALVFTLVTLLDDPTAADVAVEATEPVAKSWDTAARIGLADAQLHASATKCVRAAADRVPETLQGSMDRLVEIVERRGSPGDEFTELAGRHGAAAAVAHIAGGNE